MNMFSLITEKVSQALLSTSFLSPRHSPDVSEEEGFKKAIAAINPKMGIAILAPNTSSENKEAALLDLQIVISYLILRPSSPDTNTRINNYPRFPLKDTRPVVYPDTLSSEQKI